ncbi:MAG: type II toxin-antitoxin system HicA family toxin [Hyphomicrobiaceae bacterium]
MAKLSRDIIRLLAADGWYEVGQTGSHKHFKHPAKQAEVTVPHPKRDLPVKTVKSIERQSGVDLS